MGQKPTKNRSGYNIIKNQATIDDIYKSYPFFKKYSSVGMTIEAATYQLKKICGDASLPPFQLLPEGYNTNNKDIYYYCGMWNKNLYNTVFIGRTSKDEDCLYTATLYWPTFGSDKMSYI